MTEEDAGVWGCYYAEIQMLNRDGNHSILVIWNIVVNNDVFQTSTLLQRLTHRGRRQWLMLWSWWVVCWYSRAARCPCITSQPYIERGDEAAFHGYPLQTHFLLPAYTLRVTLGTLVNIFWVLVCVSWGRGRVNLCHWATLSRAFWINSRQTLWSVTTQKAGWLIYHQLSKWGQSNIMKTFIITQVGTPYPKINHIK